MSSSAAPPASPGRLQDLRNAANLFLENKINANHFDLLVGGLVQGSEFQGMATSRVFSKMQMMGMACQELSSSDISLDLCTRVLQRLSDLDAHPAATARRTLPLPEANHDGQISQDQAVSLLLSVSQAAQTLEAGGNGADSMSDGAGVPEDRDSTMTSSGMWQFVGPTQGGSDDENESEPDETMGPFRELPLLIASSTDARRGHVKEMMKDRGYSFVNLSKHKSQSVWVKRCSYDHAECDCKVRVLWKQKEGRARSESDQDGVRGVFQSIRERCETCARAEDDVAAALQVQKETLINEVAENISEWSKEMRADIDLQLAHGMKVSDIKKRVDMDRRKVHRSIPSIYNFSVTVQQLSQLRARQKQATINGPSKRFPGFGANQVSLQEWIKGHDIESVVSQHKPHHCPTQ